MEEKEILEKMGEKRKLPEKVKNKIVDEVCECLISAIIVYVYFIFLKLGQKNIHPNIYLTDLRVFGISAVVISIIFFENAYNKKNSKSLYRGIEVLVLAIITMLLQYFVLYLTPRYSIMIPMFALIYNIYYTLKSFIVMYKVKNDYKRSLSDIKEIINNKSKVPPKPQEEVHSEIQEEIKEEPKEDVKKENKLEIKKEKHKQEKMQKKSKKEVKVKPPKKAKEKEQKKSKPEAQKNNQSKKQPKKDSKQHGKHMS